MKKILIIMALLVVLTGCNPLKVTDPNDPKFDPEKFKFSDYRDPDDLNRALKALFPEETEKEKVDEVLVKIGQAFSKDYGDGLFSYRHKASSIFPVYIDCPEKMNWSILIKYNSNNKIKSVKLRGPC